MKANTYLNRANKLLISGEKSDGCTSPFSKWIHTHINQAKLICAAHDFGSRGLIKDVRPGWHNNVMLFKTNWHCSNYVWAVISFLATLPYALARYNIGIKISVAPFYWLFFLLLTTGCLYLYATI